MIRKKIGLIVFLVVSLIYLFLNIMVYSLNHIQEQSNLIYYDSFVNQIPNVNNCNLDYFNFSEHIESGNFENVRYRKIVTVDDNCFGKVLYSSVDLGKEFKDIDKNQYIEFGIGQKLGFNLWLYETRTLWFLFYILLISIFQIFMKKRNLFIFFLLSVFLISFLSFNDQNMFLNSKNKILPNIDTSNENLMIDLVQNDY